MDIACNSMMFHIEFSDGSNPYVKFPCDEDEFDKELKKWWKNYDLDLIKVIDNIYFYRATLGKRMKDLKRGEWFTLRHIEKPKETQVYIRSDYDRSERKYWAQKWSDIGDGKLVNGDTRVYTDFIF